MEIPGSPLPPSLSFLFQLLLHLFRDRGWFSARSTFAISFSHGRAEGREGTFLLSRIVCGCLLLFLPSLLPCEVKMSVPCTYYKIPSPLPAAEVRNVARIETTLLGREGAPSPESTYRACRPLSPPYPPNVCVSFRAGTWVGLGAMQSQIRASPFSPTLYIAWEGEREEGNGALCSPERHFCLTSDEVFTDVERKGLAGYHNQKVYSLRKAYELAMVVNPYPDLPPTTSTTNQADDKAAAPGVRRRREKGRERERDLSPSPSGLNASQGKRGREKKGDEIVG